MRLLPLTLLFLYISFGQNIDFKVAAISEELTQNANAVVRLNHKEVNIEAIDRMRIKFRRVVTILNDRGNKHVRASLGYNNGIRVKAIEATIYDASGSEVKRIKRNQFNDVSAVNGGTLYTDSRVMYLKYTPTQYPYTVDFYYEFITESTALIPSWYFVDSYLVGVESSIYQVNYALPSLKPIVKELNLDGIEIKSDSTTNSIAYQASDLKAIKRETLCPSLRNIAPKIMVRLRNFQYEGIKGNVNNWNEMGHWVQENLLTGRDDLPIETIGKVKKVVSGVTDTLERAKKIYEFVQNHTRYVSVQVGIGGIQPISAIEVDKVKYGDCKGLSNYTKALLKAVDVPAYYVHVEAGNERIDFEEDFPDLGQGNHVILAIPYKGSYYWIDCTSQIHPFGFLGDFTDDRKVLLIKPEGGVIIKTPSYTDEFNSQLTKATASLDATGRLKAEVVIETKGIQYDNRFHLEEDSRHDIDKHYKEYWDHINAMELKSFKFLHDKAKMTFVERLEVEAPGYSSNSGTKILLAPNAFNRITYTPPRYRNRKLPFVISRGYMDEDRFHFKLPSEFTLETLPANSEIESEFGHYQVDISFNKETNSLDYYRRILIKDGSYPKEKYSEYRAFRRNVAKLENIKIVLAKADIKQ